MPKARAPRKASPKKAPTKKRKVAKAKTAKPRTAEAATPKARKPARLPKSDGNAGVAAYISSLEPWQRTIAQRVDAIATKQVSHLRKALRWHVPFYGVEGQGWFLAMAAFQRHIKITFFKGTSLKPVPPAGGGKEGRSLDVRQTDKFDDKRITNWIKQASSIPGWGG